MNPVAKEVTQRIMGQLAAGVCPWKQPWTAQSAVGMPSNAITGRGYSGVNVLLLWSQAAERGYSSSRWLTFKQALDAGGHVRKGEKGAASCLCRLLRRQTRPRENLTACRS